MMFRNSRIDAGLIVIVALVAAACGSSGGGSRQTSTPNATYAPAIDPTMFTDQVTNPYFPLAPGTTYVFEGTADGVAEHNEVTVTHDTKTILGVRCVVVHDVVTRDGEVAEDTLDWYAQDSAGNVWYFGEDTKEYEGGTVKSTAGSWEAGVNGAQPGMVMKAAPSVGETYRQEYYAGEAEDMAKVLELSASKTVQNGSYTDVIVTEDFTALVPDLIERKYYAPNVGFIFSEIVKGGSERTQLIEVRTE